jgi:regulatory protein spx
MITFYYGASSTSSQRAEDWFVKLGVEVCMKKINQISKEDLFQILFLSNKGFPEILKSKERTCSRYDKLIQECQELTFNQALDFVLEHPELLRTPLIFNHHNLVIGFNEDEIRTFLPQGYRKQKLKRIVLQ